MLTSHPHDESLAKEEIPASIQQRIFGTGYVLHRTLSVV